MNLFKSVVYLQYIVWHWLNNWHAKEIIKKSEYIIQYQSAMVLLARFLCQSVKNECFPNILKACTLLTNENSSLSKWKLMKYVLDVIFRWTILAIEALSESMYLPFTYWSRGHYLMEQKRFSTVWGPGCNENTNNTKFSSYMENKSNGMELICEDALFSSGENRENSSTFP